MHPNLLLFDIGNTSIKVGLASHEEVCSSYTLRTDTGQTSDSLGLTLLTLLQHAQCPPSAITACLISSVVPAMDPLLRECIARYLACPVYFVPQDLPVPLHNGYAVPTEVGADRLVGAYAARCLYPDTPSLIIIDFGTAVTFDCVEQQTYRGGLIFPGPQTALSALSRNAAKLPRVNLVVEASEPEIGRDTATGIRHGLVFGFAGMVESLVNRLSKQLEGPVAVCATGGFAPSIARICHCIDTLSPSLLLDGLRRIYLANRNT